MNYAEMEAGPEMDCELAERVMGWRWLKDPEEARRLGVICPCWLDQDGDVAYSDIRSPERFCPSSYASHAIRVLEHLHAKDWHIVLVNCPGCDDQREKGWACDIITPDGENGAISIHADTLPLAICRAALMALKPEGE